MVSSWDAAEEQAKSILPPMLYDYFSGGADEEVTLRENVKAFRRIRLRGRTLHPFLDSDMTCSLPGASDLSFPCIIAPMGLTGLITPGGEEYLARAAAACGVKMTVGLLSISSLEAISAAAPLSEPWFQLYCMNVPGLTLRLAERAAASGYGAIVVTVDVPMLGDRRRDVRNGLTLPEGVTFGNFDGAALPGMQGALEMTVIQKFAAHISPCTPPSWIGELTERTGLPVWVKGVLHPEDARAAALAGAAGVIVSNHGGRQLDCAPSTASALPDIRAAVGSFFPLIVDGGVRTGADVAKALALGADAVMVGRPILWALANEGPEGVVRLLTRMKEEFYFTLRMLGCPSAMSLRAEGDFYRAEVLRKYYK